MFTLCQHVEIQDDANVSERLIRRGGLAQHNATPFTEVALNFL